MEPVSEVDAITSAERAQLVARCLAGDPVAIGELVRSYERLVYRVCWRMLGHHASPIMQPRPTPPATPGDTRH